MKFTVKIGDPYITYKSIKTEALVIIHIPMEYKEG